MGTAAQSGNQGRAGFCTAASSRLHVFRASGPGWRPAGRWSGREFCPEEFNTTRRIWWSDSVPLLGGGLPFCWLQASKRSWPVAAGPLERANQLAGPDFLSLACDGCVATCRHNEAVTNHIAQWPCRQTVGFGGPGVLLV